MGKIVKLPSDVINKIAAGEVVESPASVIKELVENSLDAGSTYIEVAIKEAGLKEIRVLDNGEGILKEDVPSTIERHATSKIKSEEDLYRIYSYGFRGEALASISAVSNFIIETQHISEDQGLKIIASGGIIRSKETIVRNHGTEIIVRDLFFNQPVRKKFLPTINTLNNRILETFIKLALPNFNVHFRFIRDGKEIYNLSPTYSYKERFFQIYPEFDENDFLFLEIEEEYYKLYAILSHPRLTKPNRKYQYIFVNKRWVEYKNLGFILKESYLNIIPDNRYPIGYLFLQLPPDFIEVNIHPTKKEIKFYNEPSLIRFLIKTIKNFLKNSEIKLAKEYFEIAENTNYLFGRLNTQPKEFLIDEGEDSQAVQQSFINLLFSEDSSGKSNEDSLFEEKNIEKNSQIEYSPKYFQIFNKFIVTTLKDSVIFIDQHAAHERVLYDEAIKQGKNLKIPSKSLLFPETIELSAIQYETAIANKEYLEKVGFYFREFSGNTIILESCPEVVKVNNAKNVFLDMLDELVLPEYVHLDPMERIVKTYSCKAAIKFGDVLSIREMEELVIRLFSTTNPSTCPHGRPIIYTLSLSELEKKFHR